MDDSANEPNAKLINKDFPQIDIVKDGHDGSGAQPPQEAQNNYLLSSTGGSAVVRKNSLKGVKLKNRVQGSSFFVPKNEQITICQLKLLADCTQGELEDMIIKKLNQCCIMFNFVDVSSHLKEKEIKRSILIELIDFFTDNSTYLTKPLYPHLFKTFEMNIIRVLPPNDYTMIQTEMDDESQAYEASWPHLQLVYELFLTVVEAGEFQPKFAMPYLSQSFISKIIYLFNSQDTRERDCLKTVLHRVYGKFLTFRNFIRQLMNNVFLQFVFENEDFNGIAELLEIYGSIINGFALPLKNEHKLFFKNVLLPLHKAHNIYPFHGQLVYCVLQFLEKDVSLVEDAVKVLKKYWPKVSSQKEILFLGELEEILENVDCNEMESVLVETYKIISRSLKSEHFQVSERALCFWQNDYLTKQLCVYNELLIPIILPNLIKTMTEHWNTAINMISQNVLSVIVEMNPELCSQLVHSYREELEKRCFFCLLKNSGNEKVMTNLADKLVGLGL